MKRTKVRADLIARQLQKRHAEDVFLTEVKNGRSWDSDNLLIMDAVAFKKSWKNPLICGYEIKVNRGDFLQDTKWQGYLKYCHQFYFVCPSGLIQPEEIPAEVGLIWYNPEKDCITTKRKAVYRPIDMASLWEMLYYLVICRPKSDKHPFFSSVREYCEAYVQDKEDRHSLAYSVREKVGRKLIEANKRASEAERKAEALEAKIRRYEEIEKVLQEFSISGTWRQSQADALRAALQRTMPAMIVERIQEILRASEHLRIVMEKVERKTV